MLKVDVKMLLLVLVALAASSSSIVVALTSIYKGVLNVLYPTAIILAVTSTLLVLAYTIKSEESLVELVRSVFVGRGDKKVFVKPRRRYLVFRICCDAKLSRSEVESLISDGLRRFAGALGLAFSGLRLLDYDENSMIGILRFYHRERELVLSALNFITKSGRTPIAIYPVKISGTVKKAREIFNNLSVD